MIIDNNLIKYTNTFVMINKNNKFYGRGEHLLKNFHSFIIATRDVRIRI